MHDLPKILIGLAIFVVLAAFPVWYNLASEEKAAAPELVYPADAATSECVLPEGQMRTQHMDLLMDWREEVVRKHDRLFTDHQGRQFDKSLTNTCLDCHSNRDSFCDRCHSFMDVDPYCWDCHIVPQDLPEGGAQ